MKIDFNKVDLPGVGKKYIISLNYIDIVVIHYNTGKKEFIFHKRRGSRI